MTYKTNEKEQEKIRKSKENAENILVCEFTESNTYEEFRMRVSSKCGYSPKSKFLDPFYHHILRVNHKRLYGFLENIQFMIAPIAFNEIFRLFGFNGKIGILWSFLYLIPMFFFSMRNFSLSLKIDSDEKWYLKNNEHLYAEEK